jgi:hypothetical protein
MHGLPCSALLEPLQPLRERQERAAEEGKGGGDHEDRLYSGGSSDLAGRGRILQQMWERRERDVAGIRKSNTTPSTQARSVGRVGCGGVEEGNMCKVGAARWTGRTGQQLCPLALPAKVEDGPNSGPT